MKASTGIAARASSLVSPTVAVALVIVAVALDSGGYGGVPLGIGAAVAWLGVIVVAFGPGPVRLIDRWFAAAALILAALTLMTAVSLGWSLDDGAGFADVVRLGAYLGAFVLTGLLLRAGAGRAVLEGVGAGLVAVSVIALASRLLDLGAGDTALVAATPSFAGRLSYPIGYWNALGAMAAMAAPVLIWIASDFRGRAGPALALAGIPAGGARRLSDVVARRVDRRRDRGRHRDRRRRVAKPSPGRARRRGAGRHARRARRDRGDRDHGLTRHRRSGVPRLRSAWRSPRGSSSHSSPDPGWFRGATRSGSRDCGCGTFSPPPSRSW